VVQATHGQHALNLISSGSTRPDLVISDVMMPLVGGAELCRTLKADLSTANIPIVLMSAAYPRASTNAGADAVIGKPFDLDTLDALVHRLLLARNKGADGAWARMGDWAVKQGRAVETRPRSWAATSSTRGGRGHWHTACSARRARTGQPVTWAHARGQLLRFGR